MLLTTSTSIKTKNSPNQDLVENNADLISQSSSLITAPSKPTTNMYSSPTNNALSNLDKQLRRFNGDAQRADEDRTQSFLNKVNAHIITHHLIAPSSDHVENKSSFASFGKSSHNNQVTFSNGGGFFLHSNVFYQAPNKS